jgi:UDP-N-acetyl-D-mannosaminuronate dehydrogenase
MHAILSTEQELFTDDVRESAAVDIMHLLVKRGANVSYSDPHVPSVSSMDTSVRPKTSQAAWSGQIAS